MKTKVIGLLIGFFIHCNIYAQKVSNINFDEVKQLTQDSNSPYFFPKLLSRFIIADTTLTQKEFSLLYYGNSYQKSYSPYGNSDKKDEFYKFYNKKNYKEAIPIGEKILSENAINLKMSFKLLVCYNELGDTLMAKKFARRYFPLLRVIYHSGDGKSIETAYVVINVDDEYQLLQNEDLESTGQSLIGVTDKLTINTTNQKEEPIIKELYFNVSRPFAYLTEQFNKK